MNLLSKYVSAVALCLQSHSTPRTAITTTLGANITEVLLCLSRNFYSKSNCCLEARLPGKDNDNNTFLIFFSVLKANNKYGVTALQQGTGQSYVPYSMMNYADHATCRGIRQAENVLN